MHKPHNGVPADQLRATGWRKSGRSSPSGNCVELSELADSPAIAVRNSRDPQGPALVYTRAEIAAFVQGAKDGASRYPGLTNEPGYRFRIVTLAS